ncbi:hypothetical protein [Leptospira haakeii]|uniref:DUF4785 domain-containing protein n=1 Tax=Leptospira haakeii TaxID=2023198 RepID=A0ABX4PQB4_9LEPT|nr:hypothetical protein [Leptospira haakeii]PKA17198.1 hypothetical protein CH363_00615 [Leptospira haakeii]PKA20922.1 hypothetical protein CH377_00615 [Leptospira haakeii]
MSQKKIFIYLGIAIAAALVFYLLRDEAEENGWFLSEEEKKAKAEWMAKGSPPGGSSASENPNFLESLDESIPPEKILKDYLEWSEYPPNSRPLSKFNEDLTNPYFIQLSPIAMVDKPEDKKPNGYSCKLQPLQWAAIGVKDPLHITLECFNTSNFEKVPLNIRNVKLWKEFDGNKFVALPPDGNDKGIDGDAHAKDNIFTFEWRPTYKDWGDMFLEVEFEYAKEKKQGKVLSSFFSSPYQPAEWSGYFLDVPRDGSLSVKTGVNVFKAGTYHLEANLVNAGNGDPIAWASFDGKLNAGRQEVEFLFFGKLIRESGYEGPYALTQLRGHRVNLAVDPDWFGQGEEGMRRILAAKTTEPDKELVGPYNKENYTTKEYNLNTFSLKAYESPEKDQKVKQLQDLAR